MKANKNVFFGLLSFLLLVLLTVAFTACEKEELVPRDLNEYNPALEMRSDGISEAEEMLPPPPPFKVYLRKSACESNHKSMTVKAYIVDDDPYLPSPITKRPYMYKWSVDGVYMSRESVLSCVYGYEATVEVRRVSDGYTVVKSIDLRYHKPNDFVYPEPAKE